MRWSSWPDEKDGAVGHRLRRTLAKLVGHNMTTLPSTVDTNEVPIVGQEVPVPRGTSKHQRIPQEYKMLESPGKCSTRLQYA
jgi:hypothetical protein